MKAARVIAWLTLLLTVASCTDDGTPRTVFTDRDSRYEVAIGEEIRILLESNITTGFGWSLSADLPPNVLSLASQRYMEAGTDVVGAPGADEFIFRAVGDGSTFIQLWYVRPFDDPPEPADRAQFEVIVGTGDPGQPIDPREIDEPAATTPDDEEALDVSAAATLDGPVTVRGFLYEDTTGMVLCETLAESFPPQCIGASMPIANGEAIDTDFTEEAGVRWTDRVVVLTGEMVDGTLQISG